VTNESILCIFAEHILFGNFAEHILYGNFAEHILYDNFAEHICADASLCDYLSSLFNQCLMHGKIPQECMQTVTVPICKNKNGDISDTGNCWPVSLATIISKLLEHYILSCISPLSFTTDNQFSFKQKHGADMCIFLLKQTVSYYVKKDTLVFSAFLDASKAFDRTNHSLLFAKLMKRLWAWSNCCWADTGNKPCK